SLSPSGGPQGGPKQSRKSHPNWKTFAQSPQESHPQPNLLSLLISPKYWFVSQVFEQDHTFAAMASKRTTQINKSKVTKDREQVQALLPVCFRVVSEPPHLTSHTL